MSLSYQVRETADYLVNPREKTPSQQLFMNALFITNSLMSGMVVVQHPYLAYLQASIRFKIHV